MAKAHRAYRHTWYEKRFQQLGLFASKTETEYGWTYSNRVIHENNEGDAKLEPRQQLRWLRETLAKMDEARNQKQDWGAYFQEKYEADWMFLPDDEKHRLIMWAETIPDGYEPTLSFAA